MSNQKVIVYADLNCPFCFALHERLISANYINDVEWRCIEHAPEIRFDINDYLMQSELSEEVTKVRVLAPEVTIMIPRARPNTSAATKLVIEVYKSDPQKALALRTLCYRELWIKGNDISNAKTLESLLREAEIESIDVSGHTLDQLEIWQKEWEEGDFSRNIPVVISKEGNKLLGLPSNSILSAFFQGNTVQSDDVYDGVCFSKTKENILILTPSAELFKNINNILGKEFAVSQATSKSMLLDKTLSGEEFDLIILAESFGEDSYLDLAHLVRCNDSLQSVPVILIALSTDLKMEIQAFEIGVNDFIASPYADEVLLARVRLQLRLKRTIDLLEQHARMDSLTEIPNRREYNRAVEREWRQAIRSKTAISIILLDVDYFKAYNDHYGHMQGDICLKNVAKLLDSCRRRPSDIAARYGGEEFVMILPSTDLEGACVIANNIREALASNKMLNKSSPFGYVTISQGVASMEPTTSSQLSDLVDSADKALYDAKDAGRDQVKP